MERKNNTIIVTTRVPSSLNEKLDKKVESSEYMSKSDLVRTAIRKMLEGG